MWGQFADDILAIEEVTSVNTEGDILWALSDQVFTVRDIGEWDSTNSEFVIANHRVYNSYGELESETDSSVEFAFGFTGKWVEEETGYSHHLNRWFDPAIGKWISEDPIGFAGGDANISRYVSNNVLSRVDSNGLFGGPGIGNADPPVSTGAGGGERQEQEEQEEGEDDQEGSQILVISGFGEWDGDQNGTMSPNASEDIANRINKGLGRPDVKVVIIPVNWDAAGAAVKEILKGLGDDEEIDVWIGIGEEGNAFHLEKKGRNERGPENDNNGASAGSGANPRNVPGNRGDDENTLSTPQDLIDEFNAAMKAKGHDDILEPDEDASQFVCEELCYILGQGIEDGTIGSGIFIHIPPGLGLDDDNNNETRDDVLVQTLIDYINNNFPPK